MPELRHLARAVAATAATAAMLALPVLAEEYPTRPIKIVIGFAPGGSTDAPMRVLAEAASKLLKQPVIIENKPGAGGTLPGIVLQSAANDGYTLGIASLGIYR